MARIIFCFLTYILLNEQCDFCFSSECIKTEHFLNCKERNLTKIPPSLPEGVKSVDLSNNHISNITSIPETSTLLNLDLSSNGVSTLMYHAFHNLDNLQTLILSNNNIEKIVDDIFVWNPLKLEVLRLDNNKLEFIQHFLLYDLDRLQELDLHNNNISFIHPHAFAHLWHLTRLRLNGNNLFTFEHKWISGMKSNFMTELKFENNPWSCDCAMTPHVKWMKSAKWFQHLIHGQAFTCQSPASLKDQNILLPTVTEMNAACGLPTFTQLSPNTELHVGDTLKLQCVVLGLPHATITWTAPNGNEYNYYNADWFEGIEAYQNGTLVIHKFETEDFGTYNCTATNFKGSVQYRTKVTQATGPNDTPMDKPDEINVDDIVLSIRHSSQCPYNCTCLASNTDCSGDGSSTDGGLQEVPQGMPAASTTISLTSNSIRTIRATDFASFTDLSELRLDNNKIAVIAAGALDHNSKLRTLTLRGNKLTSFPNHLFKNLVKLNILVLDNNELEIIHAKWFADLNKLQWLYIRSNRITNIQPHAFKGMTSLRLNICLNAQATWWLHLLHVCACSIWRYMHRFLHLEQNLLAYLELLTIQDLTEMKQKVIQKISIGGNPFDCQCSMNDLRNYLEQNRNLRRLFGDGIECQFPAKLAGKFLTYLTSNVTCPDAATNQPESVHVGTSVVMWFAGASVGIIICIASFYVWKKNRCNFKFEPNYSSHKLFSFTYSYTYF